MGRRCPLYVYDGRMNATYVLPIAKGTRVRVRPEAPNPFNHAPWFGVVTGEPLQPGDSRVCVRIDSGARILYSANRLEEVNA